MPFTPKAPAKWQRVKFAAELPACELCGEPFCPTHRKHYADCTCPGPDQEDEFDYQERGGELFARKKKPRR